MFSPIRALFKWDFRTIYVNHVVDPEKRYATVKIDGAYKVTSEIHMPKHDMMTALVNELVNNLQKFANRWRLFYAPEGIVKLFVKTQRL